LGFAGFYHETLPNRGHKKGSLPAYFTSIPEYGAGQMPLDAGLD